MSVLLTNKDDDTTVGRDYVHGDEISARSTRSSHQVVERSATHLLSFYKLFWIFFLASIGGLIFEQIFCFIFFGLTENRAGLVYGPFSPIYGFGAILITLLLYRIRYGNPIVIFMVSSLIGGVFEYLSGLFLATRYSVVSWNYSYMTFNINGWISIESIVLWGFLGLFWMKLVVPAFSHRFDHIHIHAKRSITILLAIFMAFDILITYNALGRQAERRAGDVADTAIERFLDDQYSDEYLATVFENMRPIHDADTDGRE
ncbi:MAG: putative ABC transporter permease [Actinobacteria bacterium]|nr:putative ABC transporter permease [Actinomycetota bacterium]